MKFHGTKVHLLILAMLVVVLAAVSGGLLYSSDAGGASPTAASLLSMRPQAITPLTVSPTPDPTAVSTPDPTPLPTSDPSVTPPPAPSVFAQAEITGTEPTVAVDPATGDIAVAAQHVPWPALCSHSSVVISRDGGKSWSAPIYPMGSGCQDIHAVVAWGPKSRLWFGDALGVSGGVKMGVTYSDNFGASWAPFYVQTYTRAWAGCFPMMIVDNDPVSPAYGTLYAAYNWLPNSYGPGLHVLAKPLDGPWTAVEVPAVGLKGYPAHNRIGYRIIAAAGGLVVAWYESDLRAFPTGDILSDGSGSNVGRAGFATAALSWSDDGKLTVGTPTWAGNVTSTTDLLRDPRWQYQLAAELAPVRGARWRDGAIDLWLAVSDGAGHILVGERASGGDWAWTKIGAGFKPVLAIDPGSGIVFLGWHAGSPIRNYYSLSADGGRTWTAPAQAGPAWGQPGVINGAGLRENAVYDGTSGAFVWAFGDGAKAARVIVIRP